MIHTVAHIVKFVPEALSVIAAVLGLLAILLSLGSSENGPDAWGPTVIAIFLGGGLALLALISFSCWWALVYFAHLPWWG